ncbi:MAG: tetratricopeptide repeat protein [Planctomycetes bacterium]|nr:tetratricopeptide repeat protein [Planctomycetota bacterium]
MRAATIMVGAAGLLSVSTLGCQFFGSDRSTPESVAVSRQYTQQGIGAIERNDWQEARALLGKAIKNCPTDPEARRHYAETLWHQGASAEAIQQLEEAVRLAPDEAPVYVQLSRWWLARGNVDAASHYAQQALDLDPELAAAWMASGRAMRADEQPRRALSDFHRALTYAPNDQAMLLEIAELHRQLNQPQRALATLHSLVDTYPPGETPGRVIFLEGLAYKALGRWDDAASRLATAATHGNPTPEILFHLGEAQHLAGHHHAAASTLRRALALEPEHQPSLTLLERMAARRPSAEDRQIR